VALCHTKRALAYALAAFFTVFHVSVGAEFGYPKGTSNKPDTYEAVIHPSCGRLHFTSGKFSNRRGWFAQVLYHHPATHNVTSPFRTISIYPEIGGRVAEVYVGYNEQVKQGQPLFKMDSSRQEADIGTARPNAYTSNHDLIASGKVGTLQKIYLHGVDAVALIHALIIRMQAIVMPLKVLVFANFGGGH
jgi:Biotin-lipoyl like